MHCGFLAVGQSCADVEGMVEWWGVEPDMVATSGLRSNGEQPDPNNFLVAADTSIASSGPCR